MLSDNQCYLLIVMTSFPEDTFSRSMAVNADIDENTSLLKSCMLKMLVMLIN